MTLLVRPDNRVSNYQDLNKLSAIEPPIYMALRASVVDSPVVVDEEVGDVIPYGEFDIEIFPSGSHPSSVYQKLGVAYKFKDAYGGKVWTELPYFNIDNHPRWDLFDLKRYRSHNWHCWGGKDRQGYAVIMASYGCPYKCKFCSIRDFNRNIYGTIPLDAIYKTAEEISRQGVKNVKFIDEMFLFDEDRTRDICDILREHNFNIWAYARIDRISDGILRDLKSAGFNWLGIGIESGSEDIRKAVLKNALSNEQIADVVKRIRDAGINVGGNFMIGFPEDDAETIQKTLDFALELKCEYTNMNPVMAFPGSEYYEMAIKNGWGLPENCGGYSYYSYDCVPMGGNYLSPMDVLCFRDSAFREFYTDSGYLKHMKERFGDVVVKEIEEMVSIPIRRKLVDEAFKG